VIRRVNLTTFDEIMRHAESLGYTFHEARNALDCVFPYSNVYDLLREKIPYLPNEKARVIARSFLSAYNIDSITFVPGYNPV